MDVCLCIVITGMLCWPYEGGCVYTTWLAHLCDAFLAQFELMLEAVIISRDKWLKEVCS